jgi:predicted nucleic acid-binding protein
MILYCDTSFLVSYLNEEDINHNSSRTMAARFDSHEFVLCEVHQLELPAAVRAAVHRSQSPIPPRLGEVHGWKARHTTFDLWHLGAAWSLSAGAFLTFDERQKRIARLLGMAE